MKKALTILSIFLNFLIFAQSIKEYSGDYKGGKATYNYFEDSTGKRILHGNFSFTGSFFKDDEMLSKKERTDLDVLIFKGVNIYSSPFMIAKFLLEIQDEDYNESRINPILYLIDGQQVGSFKGGFENGKKSGLWIYSFHNKFNNIDMELKLEMKNDSLVNGTFEQKVIKNKIIDPTFDYIKLSFNKFGYSGAFIYNSTSFNIKGQMKDGKCVGIWDVVDKNPNNNDISSSKLILKYIFDDKKGTVISKKILDPETGELIEYTPNVNSSEETENGW